MTEFQPQTNDVLSRVQRQNQEDAALLAAAINQTQESQQPFMGADEKGKPVIVGDVTNISNPKDYTVTFEYPKDMALKLQNKEFTDLGNGWVRFDRLFKEIQLTPKKAAAIKHQAAVILDYMSRLTGKNIQLEILTIGDAYAVFKEFPEELIDAVYRVVQVPLGISDSDIEYVDFESALNTATQLIVNNAGFFQRDIESAAANNS